MCGTIKALRQVYPSYTYNMYGGHQAHPRLPPLPSPISNKKGKHPGSNHQQLNSIFIAYYSLTMNIQCHCNLILGYHSNSDQSTKKLVCIIYSSSISGHEYVVYILLQPNTYQDTYPPPSDSKRERCAKINDHVVQIQEVFEGAEDVSMQSYNVWAFQDIKLLLLTGLSHKLHLIPRPGPSFSALHIS